MQLSAGPAMQPTVQSIQLDCLSRSLLSGLRAALTSTLALTCIFLTAANWTIATVKPLKYLNTSGFTPLDQNPLVSKLPEFIHSQENPDILLLGSSLTLIPAVRCDDELAGTKSRYDSGYRRNYINCYSKAETLKLGLEKQLGQPLQIRNLGVIASMFSDHELILEKALKAGKKPRLVICCTAPRDFLDNYRAVVEQTPVFQVLSDLSNLQDLSQRGASLPELANRALEQAWHYYQVRADYRTVACAATAKFLGHPRDLYQAKQSRDAAAALCPVGNDDDAIEIGLMDKRNKPDYKEPANTLADLPTYKQVYQPVNCKLFEIQSSYLTKLLKLCQTNHISALIVNMPLTEANKKLLPDDAWCKYKSFLDSTTQRYNASYLDADQPGVYSMADFEDSCHMNSRGGRKFYKMLIEKVAASQCRQSLAANRGSL